MKWPKTLTLIRHGESEFNALKKKKAEDPLYQKFVQAYEANFPSPATRMLAEQVWEKFALNVSDEKTPLTAAGSVQAAVTGQKLEERREIHVPDAIYYSPYLRAEQTLQGLKNGWSALRGVKRCVPDDRIREQDHGLALLYNDWRLFNVFHPEEKRLRELLGPYWYRYPGGESVSDVRNRWRLFTDMLIREHANRHVLLITHHLTILSVRANLERLSPEEFVRIDKEEKPANCGVTIYLGHPRLGREGQLHKYVYNKVYY